MRWCARFPRKPPRGSASASSVRWLPRKPLTRMCKPDASTWPPTSSSSTTRSACTKAPPQRPTTTRAWPKTQCPNTSTVEKSTWRESVRHRVEQFAGAVGVLGVREVLQELLEAGSALGVVLLRVERRTVHLAQGEEDLLP